MGVTNMRRNSGETRENMRISGDVFWYNGGHGGREGAPARRGGVAAVRHEDSAAEGGAAGARHTMTAGTATSDRRPRPGHADIPFPAILDRARALDGHALGILYERYLPVIYRFIFLRVGDTHLAEDLTSDVFFTVVAHIGQLRAEDELAFAAWMLRIARNAVSAHFRKARAQPLIEQDEAARLALAGSAEEGDPLAIITSREDWSEVVAALNRLTEDQRNVVLYRCLLGYSTEEVGEFLHKRPGSIRALQFRALASLARLLDRAERDQVARDGRDVAEAPQATARGRRRGDGAGR